MPRILKTLADIKRACTIGARLTMTYHIAPHIWRSPDIRQAIEAGAYTRRLIKTQGNAIVFESPTSPGGSWLTWPKAADVRIDGPDTFSILEGGVVQMTYRVEAD